MRSRAGLDLWRHDNRDECCLPQAFLTRDDVASIGNYIVRA